MLVTRPTKRKTILNLNVLIEAFLIILFDQFVLLSKDCKNKFTAKNIDQRKDDDARNY